MELKVKKKKLTLSTKEGCVRLLCIFMAVILVSSLIAQLISTNGGKIKIEEINTDVRGAVLDGELYYPAGISDKDKLPAVLVIHGGGCHNSTMRGVAEELAHKGFVVFNMNAYGNGISETPVSNENGMGPQKYNIIATPMGALDAMDWLRSLKFVDSTRVGIAGHSQGSRRGGYAALMDCGYFSLNDIMINVLSDTFGQKFTESEIYLNADTLAQQRLNPDQLKYYNQLKEVKTADFNKKIKAIFLVGSTAQYCNPSKEVQVGGVKVTRNLQVNQFVLNGKYDPNYNGFINDKATKAAWYLNLTDKISNNACYVLNDQKKTSSSIGEFPKISASNNKEFADAINSRSTRMTAIINVSHPKELFSPTVCSYVVNYFTEMLNNNITPGGVTSGATSSFVWRYIMNFLALLAMIALFFPLIKLFILSKSFAGCALTESPAAGQKTNKKWIYAVVAVLTIGLGYGAIYCANNGLIIDQRSPLFASTPLFPLFSTCWMQLRVPALMGLAGLVTALVYALLTKNLKGFGKFIKSNFNFGFRNILKSVLIGFALVSVGFIAFSIVWNLFLQDFGIWVLNFGQMKMDLLIRCLSYALIALPLYLIISLCINYVAEATIGSSAKETVITVLMNSIGIWLCALVNIIVASNSPLGAPLYATFMSTYGCLFYVPIVTYILRKSYRMTKNVWVGAVVASLLLAWMLGCDQGTNSVYIAQNAMSNFLGL